MIYLQICIIFMTYILNHKPVHSEIYTFEPPNLKTVLFKDTHILGRCWSTDEVNLLLHRRVLQDLVPRKIPRDLPSLVKYLKGIEETALKSPPGWNQTLVMMAMGDVIGGYLQAIVIPIAKEAYYAGNVDYSTVAELHEMLDKWKWYLSTDGSTWSQDCDLHKIITKVALLNVSAHNAQTACQELYVSDLQTNGTNPQSLNTVISSSRIPIPYLDNNVVPNAVALPFRKRNLFSLSDPKSAYILVKYYSLSMRCLSGNPSSILAFNNHFHVWIVTKVLPHLHDEDRWFPAFGAVLRVVETIKEKSLSSTNSLVVQPIGGFEHQDAAMNANLNLAVPSLKHSGNVSNYFHIVNNPYALIILFGTMVLAVALLCCLCFCCCLRLQRKKKPVLFWGESDDTTWKNAIISVFCSLKNSLNGSLEISDKNGTRQEEIRKTNPIVNYHDRSELLPNAGSYRMNPKMNYDKSEHLPHANTPYPASPVDSSDISYSGESESEEEYNGTQRDET